MLRGKLVSDVKGYFKLGESPPFEFGATGSLASAELSKDKYMTLEFFMVQQLLIMA